MKPKLLKTADGVVIDNDSTVFIPGPWLAHCERVSYDADGTLHSMYLGTVFPNGIVDPALCYSTADAAAKAYEGMVPR